MTFSNSNKLTGIFAVPELRMALCGR